MSNPLIHGLGKGFFVFGIVICEASFAQITLSPYLATKQEMFNMGIYMMLLGIGNLVLATRE